MTDPTPAVSVASRRRVAAPRKDRIAPHKVTSATGAVEKEIRSTARGRCSGCLAFCLIGIIIIPIVLFGIAALLGALLLAVECPEARTRLQVIHNGTEPVVDSDGIDIDAMCSYYEWFKYVLGNMVAISTPLTPVTPSSGHVVGEMLDLLIATWSITVGGAFYGVIGALAFTHYVVEATEGSIVRRSQTLLFRGAVDKLVKDVSGMDFDEFRSVASKLPGHQSDNELKALFDQADEDGSGTITRSEVEELVSSLDQVQSNGADKAAGGGREQSAQLDEVLVALDSISQAVLRLGAKVAAMDARLSEGRAPSMLSSSVPPHD